MLVPAAAELGQGQAAAPIMKCKKPHPGQPDQHTVIKYKLDLSVHRFVFCDMFKAQLHLCLVQPVECSRSQYILILNIQTFSIAVNV